MAYEEPEHEADAHYVQPGDLVLLVGKDRKTAIVRMRPGQEYQSHYGVLLMADVIGRRWGESVVTHLGHSYMILPPSPDDLIRNIRRATQIIYPKEIGRMMMKMDLRPGVRVIEAGTGSGGLTLALSRIVRPEGRIFSYEARPEIQAIARRNLERLGLDDCVTFKVRNIEEGFDEQAVDVLILDVREPWLYLDQVHDALRGGGFFCSLLPTVNQVGLLLRHLEMKSFGFAEVEELFLRPYKAVPARLRPVDRMVAHTGFLVFARALLPAVDEPEPTDVSQDL